jgi:hypothetical protein
MARRGILEIDGVSGMSGFGGKRTVRYLAMLAGSGRLLKAPYGAANSFETVL